MFCLSSVLSSSVSLVFSPVLKTHPQSLNTDKLPPTPFYFSPTFYIVPYLLRLNSMQRLRLTPAGSLISINKNTDLPRRKQGWTPPYFWIRSADARGWPRCSLLKAQPLPKGLFHQSQCNHEKAAREMSFLIVLPVATRGITAQLVGLAGS